MSTNDNPVTIVAVGDLLLLEDREPALVVRVEAVDVVGMRVRPVLNHGGQDWRVVGSERPVIVPWDRAAYLIRVLESETDPLRQLLAGE